MSLGLGEGLLKVLMLHIEKQPALSLVAEAQLMRQMVGSVALVMVGVLLGDLDKALKGLKVGERKGVSKGTHCNAGVNPQASHLESS